MTRRYLRRISALTSLLCVILSGQTAVSLPVQQTDSLKASYVVDLLSRADFAWDEERFDDAADLYRQAFLLDPSIKRAAYRLGWCYNQEQRYTEAIWTLKDAVPL